MQSKLPLDFSNRGTQKMFCIGLAKLRIRNTQTNLKFDIEAFNPFICKENLSKALMLSREFMNISADDEEIIFHSRKIVLIGKDEPVWKKKNSQDFDVTMGSRNGAEICELIGLFL